MLKQKFFDDLKFGNYYEAKALSYLDFDEYIFNDNKRYDILIIKDGIYTKYEVKTDRNSWNTGTILIETEYRKKPSGLMTTEADYFIYVSAFIDDENYYKIPTNELKELIKECRSIYGGDNKNSKMYLVPIPKVAKYLINFPIKGYDYHIAGTMTEVKVPTYSERLKSFINNKAGDSIHIEALEKVFGLIDEFSKQEFEAKKASKDVMPFGKYKFKTIKEVIAFDRKYLEWFVKQAYSDEYPILKDEINTLLKL